MRIFRKIIKILFNILMFLVLSAVAFVMLFPIYLTVTRSLGLPGGFTEQNYTELLFTEFELPVLFPRYFINTVLVTVFATVLQLWATVPAAYALAKIKFPGSRFLNRLIEVGLLFGASSFFVTQYIVLNKMRLINTHPAVILPLLITSTSLGVFLIRQYAAQIPDNLIEAAQLDGVSHRKICRDVIIPQIKPARVTLIVLAINTAWRAEVHNFVYSEELKTMASVFYRLDFNESMGITLALSSVMLILPLLAFLFTQSSVTETMTQAKIKE